MYKNLLEGKYELSCKISINSWVMVVGTKEDVNLVFLAISSFFANIFAYIILIWEQAKQKMYTNLLEGKYELPCKISINCWVMAVGTKEDTFCHCRLQVIIQSTSVWLSAVANFDNGEQK